MLQKAVELEVAEFLSRDHYQRSADGLLRGLPQRLRRQAGADGGSPLPLKTETANGLAILLAYGRPWRDKVTVTAPTGRRLVFLSQHPAGRALGSRGEMTRPFNGRPSWDDGISDIIRREGKLHLVPTALFLPPALTFSQFRKLPEFSL